jgi:hypothetical protein
MDENTARQELAAANPPEPAPPEAPKSEQSPDRLLPDNELSRNLLSGDEQTGEPCPETHDPADTSAPSPATDSAPAEENPPSEAPLWPPMDPQEMMRQLEEYRRRDFQRAMADDLAAVKAAYPDEQAADVAELGREFIRLKAAGVDTLIAYEAVRAARNRQRVTPPPQAGPVTTSAKEDKEYYTSDEVDRMDPREMDDPGVIARILRSMTRWK